MPANILDPDNTRIRDIINLPDSRLQLINFGIIDDGATSLNFQFEGTNILTIDSDGDFTFDKDVSLAGSLTFLNAGTGGDPVLSSDSTDTTLTLAANLDIGDNTLTATSIQLKPPIDSIPIFETNFTKTVLEAALIAFMVFEGQNDQSTEKPYAEIKINQVDLTEDAEKGSMDFLIASGAGAPTSMLKLDGDANQIQVSADLLMGDKEIQFVDTTTFIHEHENLLELHAGTGKQIRMILGAPAGGFSYQFGNNFLNFANRGIAGMGQLQFGVGANVTIQRGTTNTNSLELDSITGGEIVLRVNDNEEYNFGATTADFNNNQIANAVLLSTVTGDTGITGLGTLSEIVFTGTDNTIFPKDSNTNLRINATTDIECEVGNGGSLVISNRSGSNLFSFSSDSANFLGSNLIDLGVLSYQSEITTLVTDVLTPDKTFTILEAETGTTDILKTINVFGAVTGQTLIITPQQGDAINVENTDNIILTNARPWDMNEVRDYMGLIFDGTNWIEQYRTEEHVSSISDGIGISSDFALGDVTITVNSTVISGQTPQVPIDTDTFLFLSGGNLRKSEFFNLAFATITGGGNDDSTGNTDKYFAFGSFGTGNTDNTLEKFPMPIKTRLEHLAVTIGTNNRPANATIGVAKNGTLTDLQVVFSPGSPVGETKLSLTEFLDVLAGDDISLIVKADPTGNTTIDLRGFSCIVSQGGS